MTILQSIMSVARSEPCSVMPALCSTFCISRVNTRCIAAVRTGYSAALRHLARTERIALSVAHEQFFGDFKDFVLLYEESSRHKGDTFTKRLVPYLFEHALTELLGMIQGPLVV